MKKSGILLPIFSLANEKFIGSISKEAYDFIDYLRHNKQSYWQVLPINPIDNYNSPYLSDSLFASNYLLIDYSKFKFELNEYYTEKVNYSLARKNRMKALEIEYKNFSDLNLLKNYLNNNKWLKEYSLFKTIEEKFKTHNFLKWPNEFKYRDKLTLKNFKLKNFDRIYFYVFVQYIFDLQWTKLKKYANSNGIKLIGDMPFYPSFNSVDVWSNPHLFKLKKNLKPKFISGYPADDFSKDGQIWGSPIYNFKEMKKNNFKWFKDRITHLYKKFDLIRLDHFLGYNKFWQIKSGAKASEGKWKKGPSYELFNELKRSNINFDFIAEDLGIITDDAIKLREKYSILSTKVYAFEKNPFNITNSDVYYSSNHDTNTLSSLTDNTIKALDMIFSSNAKITITTMQDILNQNDEYRINTPATLTNNWVYRLKSDYSSLNTNSLRFLTIKNGRQNEIIY